MPFTSQEISDAGVAALDHHIRNNPIDQVAVERPLLRKLMATQKEFPGGKQFVTEQLRDSYQQNFQWYFGAQPVTYNTRQTLKQSQFAWRGAHDGFFLDEDRLFQNGITITDKTGPKTNDEVLQLTNLFEEETAVLRLGFEEQLSHALHLNGTVLGADALAGLDHLVSTDPATGTVGGIDASLPSNTWWRNHAVGGLTSSTVIAAMEAAWRASVRNGGTPDFLLAGTVFVDTYRAAMLAAGTYQLPVTGIQRADGAVGTGTDTGLSFKKVPIIEDPEAFDIDAVQNPAIPFEKRCYFLNTKAKAHIKLRPAQGHNMISRRPPRAYDRYVHYWALTWKGTMTTNRRNAHAVISVA